MFAVRGRGWAEVLENGGRCEAAAAAYLRASLLAHDYEQIDMQRRSAKQFLIAGHMRKGLKLLDQVSSKMGQGLVEASRAHLETSCVTAGPDAPQSSARPAHDVRDAIRLEVFHVAALHAVWHAWEPNNASDLALDYLHEAERKADPHHVVRALANLAPIASEERARALLARIEDVANAHSEDTEMLAHVHLQRAILERRCGAHRCARESLAQARALFHGCAGAQLYLDLVLIMDQASAHACGDYGELRKSTPMLIDDAFSRGRIWTGTSLLGYWGMPAWLAHDEVDEYRRRVSAAESRWLAIASGLASDPTGFTLHKAAVMTTIYAGEPFEGLKLVESHAAAQPTFKHLRHRARIKGACAASALRMSARHQGFGRDQLRQLVLSAAAQRDTAGPPTQLLRTARCLDAGEEELAAQHLSAALELCEARSLSMLAAAVNRRLGQLLGGDEGRTLVTASTTFMHAQGVKNYEAMTELLCPGCVSRPSTAIS